jgi:hypothetical protein
MGPAEAVLWYVCTVFLKVVHEHFNLSPYISGCGDKYNMGKNFFIVLHFLHKYPNMTSD